MTTKEGEDIVKLERLQNNLARMEELSERLLQAFSHKRQIDPGLQGPGQDVFFKAAQAYMNDAVRSPSKVFEHQVQYWGKTFKHFLEAQEALATGKLQVPADNTPTDPRFSNPLWSTHPYFNYIKQHYLLTSDAMEKAVGEIDGLESRDRKRIEYFTRQILDMMAPTNFLSTNPDALTKAVETDGESLVRGLENLVHDIEANQGELLVTLADKQAFKVGENIATTPGEVVFRNRMFELIQFHPTTEKVHTIPLIIFPPWINKFYIMDLKEKNSLIKWIVDQGYTLFVVSWVNPDESYADVGVDTYIEEGYLTAFEQVKQICGVKKVNAVGYCIAGTTLSVTMALLNKRKDTTVNSATLFTTLTDFSDQGEFSVFLENDFVDGIEREATARGFLDSFFMSRTFSYLRANDLIYGPAIRSYMMGEAPPAFDLLYWNGDSTNLPGRMVIEYLRWLCQGNRFADGTLELMGETLSLKDVKVPVCAIACETDHIAAAATSYQGVQQMGSKNKTFILSQSGHIAGIVNPPSKKKYGHYTNEDLTLDFRAWRDRAEFHEGSWWPRWETWLSRKSGKMIEARTPGDSQHPSLCSAPGTYVLG
ncbi:PHA/PHB synthase family protein [Actibacterium ureilyticum]|uniref:PHA/PHB synthase family protein n=1 Tax=Actibacterium ureilyticum TaxID=1590614 RepID=UPI000BAAEC1D|nr:class I poly(R)-hydroxyalkanoic acid synthase [Actibacterium ureilyticum]